MKFTLTLVIIILQLNCFAQSQKEAGFKKIVAEVIDGFSRQDSAALSKLSNPHIGVYHLYAGNTFLGILHLTAVSFNAPGRFADQLRDCRDIQTTGIQYTALPHWNCEKELWSKTGLFVDTTITDHMLTKGCIFKNKHEPGSYSAKYIHILNNIENNSRRVVLQDNNGKELVFYVTCFNNKWYLTVIDKASSDCSV